ncbi:PIN-like domain-containing protein [Pseudomonas sp. A-B-19]|uniref:PIN-like domain-containing protein n=1 Tax=Pseudomonas sp. A-B-19 TaxID=2832405 RepID=UPI001CC101A3|nr:PIN domain-containing protein [Pseudomonas sp. A-B-19]
MKKMFPGYFSNDPDILNDIWGRCLFVLDANVLLSLYRYSNETRSELFEIFKLLNDRLWVPHQVASEYLVNRVSVIGQQVKVYDDAVKSVEDLRRSFENPKQHPFVQDETLKAAIVSFEKVVEDLGSNKKVYLQKIEVDDVKAGLEKLLDGRVGESLTEEEVADVLLTGPLRYLQKTPPGYKDAKKGGDSDLAADKLKPYGDYIVWRQTLAKAKADGLPVIFVTGDSKEDWWSIYSGKPLEPHPQLVDEFVKEVGQNFYMYLPEKFMERANEYLDRATSQSAIDEIVDVRAEDLAAIQWLTNQGGKQNFLMDFAYSEGDRQDLLAKLDILEKQISAQQVQIELLDFAVERKTHERQETLVRYTNSLAANNGVESPHTIRLSSTINQLGSEVESSSSDRELMHRVLQDLTLQHTAVRYQLRAIEFLIPGSSYKTN